MPRVRSNVHKKNFNVYQDERVVKEAKGLGLNMSKISENALKTDINALKESGVTTPFDRKKEE